MTWWGEKKKKKKSLSLYFLQLSPFLSWILECTVPFFPSLLTLTSPPGLLLPALCSTLPSLFPSTHPSHMPASLWLCLTSTHTNRNEKTESIRQTDAMVNEAMHGWEGCQGVQMDFDVEHFMTISVQQRKPKVPTHNNTYFNIQYT